MGAIVSLSKEKVVTDSVARAAEAGQSGGVAADE